MTLATRRWQLAITAQALNNGGGAERYARDVVQGLLDVGIHPVVIARKIDATLPQAQRTRCLALRSRGLPRLWRSAIFDWRLARFLKREKINCVFGINHTPHAQVSICGGTHPGFLQAMGRLPGWADRRQIALEKQTYTQTCRIVAHSRLMRDELLRFYRLPAEKIHVLYPPIDSARFNPLPREQRQQMRERLGLPSDRVVFLLVSTGHARKGLNELTAYFEQTDLPICLAVAGRPLLRPARNVIELGYLPEIETAYAAADYTVVASRYEPFGLVAVESVLCGTPVVIADNVGSAEVITDQAKITYDGNKTDELGLALKMACEQAQQKQHYVPDPLKHLRYDPAIATHVNALLSLFQVCCDGAAE